MFQTPALLPGQKRTALHRPMTIVLLAVFSLTIAGQAGPAFGWPRRCHGRHATRVVLPCYTPCPFPWTVPYTAAKPLPPGTLATRISFIYGNPKGVRAPAPGDPGALLNPSNEGLNPRVVDCQGKDATFALKHTGAQLYYGNGQPMMTAKGGLVMAKDAVFLNYGMRKERTGRTFFMAWQTNRDLPASQGGSSTGWVSSNDMADDGAAALAAIPRRLADVKQPLATDANGGSMTNLQP